MAENELSRLEQAFSELNKCDQKNTMEFVSKFTSYYNLFKKVFPEAIREYSLKPTIGRVFLNLQTQHLGDSILHADAVESCGFGD